MSAADDDVAGGLKLGEIRGKVTYLGRYLEHDEDENKAWAADWRKLTQKLLVLGLAAPAVVGISQTLAAILHIGQSTVHQGIQPAVCLEADGTGRDGLPLSIESRACGLCGSGHRTLESML